MKRNEIKTFPHTDSFLFLVNRLISVAFIPYVVHIWLPAIFQLINGDLCRIRNERVGAETWSSFGARWVLLTWLPPPPFHSSPPTVVGRKKEKAEPTAAQNLITNRFFILSLEGGRKEKKKKKINRLHLHIQHTGVKCRPLCRLITWSPQDQKTTIHTHTHWTAD